ncbi:hypothetical protein EVAR_33964_1 [Eumeta japonica]|uniref:Uncharacterized protein n=1 Tax=Eumeta variegata TaxID=151549 RepID=A0A4C1WZJ6_EUMVA|nr:hypothetical protein EVAR_33964_1 [Eumeta japonica]
MVNVPAFTTYCGLGAEQNRTNHCDLQVLRAIPSPAIPDRSSAQPSPSSSTSSPQFKRPKTVKYVQKLVRRIRRRLIPNKGVDGCGRIRRAQEIADGAGYQTSLPFLASTIQPASTHQVITFPDVHVSADEDMPSSSRTFHSHHQRSAFGS